MNFKSNRQNELVKREREKRNQNLYETRLAPEIKGTISFDDHVAIDPPVQLLWLEEFEEIVFLIDYEQFEKLEMEEGKSYKFKIEFRDEDEELGMDEPFYLVTNATSL